MIREFFGLTNRQASNYYRSPEGEGVPISSPNVFGYLFGEQGMMSAAGVHVTAEKALAVPAVMQCVCTIAGDCGVATRNVYVANEDDPQIDWDNPVQNLIAVAPNDECSAFEFWSRIIMHAAIWGNGYGFLERRNGLKDHPTAMFNLLPDRTKPHRLDDGRLVYRSEVGGQVKTYYKEEILHIKNMSIEMALGIPVLQIIRNTIGLALQAENFSSKFFANGSQSGGILEIPTSMGKLAADNLEEGFKKRTGPDNWFRTVILRDGAKFHQTTIDAQKSQTVELREQQVKDIARIFRIPTSKLGVADSVSYNSQEQDQLGYLNSTLSHWFCGIEGECELKLLLPEERAKRKKYIEHNKSKLVEMDQTTLNNVLAIQRQNSIINANEWRRKINLPKRKDADGDSYENPHTTGGAKHDGPTPPRGKEKKGAKKPIRDTGNNEHRFVSLDAKMSRIENALDIISRRHRTNS